MAISCFIKNMLKMFFMKKKSRYIFFIQKNHKERNKRSMRNIKEINLVRF